MSAKQRHDLNMYRRHIRKLEAGREVIGRWWTVGQLAKFAGVHRTTAYARVATMVQMNDLDFMVTQAGAITVTHYRLNIAQAGE